MRHKKAFRKFGRTPSHRRALFRNLATSLILHERIETTVEKAKDLRRVGEKLVTLGGKNTLHARRQAYAYLMSKKAVHKLFEEIGPRFEKRPGGYTRVVRSRRRPGDAAELAIIEFVNEEYSPKAKKETSSRSSARAQAKVQEDVQEASENQ
jgi:large subunit ribosomal protein L17